jgi:nucleotide-binding universal stress UspA family protein
MRATSREMISRVLVGMDGSEIAERALRYALAFIALSADSWAFAVGAGL